MQPYSANATAVPLPHMLHHSFCVRCWHSHGNSKHHRCELRVRHVFVAPTPLTILNPFMTPPGWPFLCLSNSPDSPFLPLCFLFHLKQKAVLCRGLCACCSARAAGYILIVFLGCRMAGGRQGRSGSSPSVAFISSRSWQHWHPGAHHTSLCGTGQRCHHLWS